MLLTSHELTSKVGISALLKLITSTYFIGCHNLIWEASTLATFETSKNVAQLKSKHPLFSKIKAELSKMV